MRIIHCLNIISKSQTISTFLDGRFEAKHHEKCPKRKGLLSQELCHTVANQLDIPFQLVNEKYKRARPAGCYSTKPSPAQRIWFNDYKFASSGLGGGRVAICMGKGIKM